MNLNASTSVSLADALRRELYVLARENPEVVKVPVRDKPLPNLQARLKTNAPKRGGKSNSRSRSSEQLEDSSPSSTTIAAEPASCASASLRLVDGVEVTSFEDVSKTLYRRNISLILEDGTVVLQKLAPSSYREYRKMSHEVEGTTKGSQHQKQGEDTERSRCGLELMLHLDETAWFDDSLSKVRQDEDNSPRFKHRHFGAWYDQSRRFLTLTSESKQARNREGRQAVADFGSWLKAYTERFVEPKFKHLCPAFRDELEARRKQFDWVSSFAPEISHLCRPFYSTFSPFRGFSSGLHKDSADSDVSVLLNFGRHAKLELPTLNVAVELQPFDIVFFLSNRYLHRTTPRPQDPHSPGERWAVSLFFRQRMKEAIPPYVPSASADLTHMLQEADLKRKQHIAALRTRAARPAAILGSGQQSVPTDDDLSDLTDLSERNEDEISAVGEDEQSSLNRGAPNAQRACWQSNGEEVRRSKRPRPLNKQTQST